MARNVTIAGKLEKDSTSNLEVDPLSNTAARPCTVLASIVMQNIKEIHSNLDTQSSANPWIIFFETQYLVHILHSVAL